MVSSSGTANAAPFAVDDSGSVSQGATLTLDLLANDWDPDNDSLALVGVTQGARGAVVINADSTVTYTPGANAKRGDSFQYTVTDGGTQATASVSIRLEKASRGKQTGKSSK